MVNLISKKIKTYSQGSERLKDALLLIYQNKRLKEPEYKALDSLTDKSSALSKAYQYASDISKIKKEMAFCFSFVESPISEEELKKHNIGLEDYVLYHQGYFLELVHQMKDKIFHLVDALTKIDQKKYDEPEGTPSIGALLKRPKLKNYSALHTLIEQWKQEGSSYIAKALYDRTHNHHRRSKMQLKENYQDVKLSITLLQVHTQNEGALLSEYGLEQTKLKGAESLKKWVEEVRDSIDNTKKEIFSNVDVLAASLIRVFNLPTLLSKKGIRIARISFNDDDHKRIKNHTSHEALSKCLFFNKLVPSIKSALEKYLKTELLSIYVVGSVARGEAVVGISDLNMVVVTNGNFPDLWKIIKKEYTSYTKDLLGIYVEIDIKIIQKDDFISYKYAKTAFICKTDGLLIYGQDLVKNKVFPHPGLGLAYLLNKDFKSKIEKLKLFLQANPNLPNDYISVLARVFCKDSLRLMFGEVMANEAVYSYKMEQIKEYILWGRKKYHSETWFPNDFRAICTLYLFLRPRTYTDQESLVTLIDTFGVKLYSLLDVLEEKSKIWLEDWAKKY